MTSGKAMNGLGKAGEYIQYAHESFMNGPDPTSLYITLSLTAASSGGKTDDILAIFLFRNQWSTSSYDRYEYMGVVN